MPAPSNRRHARSGFFAGLLVLTASACVQEQDYLVVERAVWFSDAESCTLDASGEPPAAMTVDVAYPTRIGMGFVVANNQSPNANSNSGIDDSQIEVESAEVNLSFSGGALANSSYELTVPNNAISGGDSLPFLITVPTETVDSIRAAMSPGQFETLEMEVVFKGRKYGASGGGKLGEVTTRAYTYPFDLCLNCIEECNAECGCPDPATGYWVGVCGFAQGAVSPPECEADTGGETGGP